MLVAQRSGAGAVLLVVLMLATAVVGAQPAKRVHRIGVLDGGFSVGGPTLKENKAGLKAEGLVEGQVAHPGGRLTGISDLAADLVPKRLELAKELVPNLRRVLVVYDVQDVKSARGARRAEEVAPPLKIPVVVRGVHTQEEAIRELKTAGSRDVILAPTSNNLEITSLILNLNLYVVAPAIFTSAFWVQGGGAPDRTRQVARCQWCKICPRCASSNEGTKFLSR